LNGDTKRWQLGFYSRKLNYNRSAKRKGEESYFGNLCILKGTGFYGCRWDSIFFLCEKWKKRAYSL